MLIIVPHDSFHREKVATRVFFFYHGYIIVYHNCPDASAFQKLFPLANIRYISSLPEGLITKGHSLLADQCNILHASTQAPPPITPPRSILYWYVVVGFAGPCSSLPSASAMTASCSPSTSAHGSGLIHSPLVSTRGGDALSMAVPFIWEKYSYNKVNCYMSKWRWKQKRPERVKFSSVKKKIMVGN